MTPRDRRLFHMAIAAGCCLVWAAAIAAGGVWIDSPMVGVR